MNSQQERDKIICMHVNKLRIFNLYKSFKIFTRDLSQTESTSSPIIYAHVLSTVG